MLQPSEENISAVLEHFKKIRDHVLRDHVPIAGYTWEPLEDFIKKPEEIRRLYLLFYQSYPRFEKEAHRAVGCGAYGLFHSVFESGYWATLFERLNLKKDGRTVEIGGPAATFASALSILGFSGTYIPIGLNKNKEELKIRVRELSYLGLEFRPVTSNVLFRAVKNKTCDVLLYKHEIDDIFRSSFYMDYYKKRREGMPKLLQHPFQRLLEEAELLFKRRHMDDYDDWKFWERMEQEVEKKPHIKKYFYDTLSLVESAVVDSCNILKKGGLLVFTQYPSSYDEKTPQVSWGEAVLPKLVKMLLESGMFTEEAKSDKNTFSHPWFVLRRK